MLYWCVYVHEALLALLLTCLVYILLNGISVYFLAILTVRCNAYLHSEILKFVLKTSTGDKSEDLIFNAFTCSFNLDFT